MKRQQERVPSIMDMLQLGGAPPDQVQRPSLLEVLQQQDREQRHSNQQVQQQPHAEAELQQQGSEKLLPCMLALKTSLDSDGNTQVSLSIDDATREVLTGLLKMSSTDELKSTPPLDFFAAAGAMLWQRAEAHTLYKVPGVPETVRSATNMLTSERALFFCRVVRFVHIHPNRSQNTCILQGK